jgi:hypothetical protein
MDSRFSVSFLRTVPEELPQQALSAVPIAQDQFCPAVGILMPVAVHNSHNIGKLWKALNTECAPYPTQLSMLGSNISIASRNNIPRQAYRQFRVFKSEMPLQSTKQRNLR